MAKLFDAVLIGTVLRNVMHNSIILCSPLEAASDVIGSVFVKREACLCVCLSIVNKAVQFVMEDDK